MLRFRHGGPAAVRFVVAVSDVFVAAVSYLAIFARSLDGNNPRARGFIFGECYDVRLVSKIVLQS